jgi:glycosyltransferase involved in cell wall biosynthesis
VRVLVVSNMYPPHHLGGYELMTWSFAEHLPERGGEVRVLTTGFRVPDPDPAFAEGEHVARELDWYWREHGFPRRSMGERLRLERHNAAVFRRHVAEFRPDAVAWWAMGGMSMSLIGLAPRLGLPAVGVVVDEWLGYGPTVDGWQRAFGRPLLAPLAERATGIPTRVDLGASARWVFVSETIRSSAREYGWSGEGLVVHGGIDPDEFPRAAPREWGGRLLCVGRIDPRKGIATAIRALAELPEASLDVIGAGDEEHLAELRQLAAGLGVGERVSFGRRPRVELAAAYAESDAVLFPVTWDEPWGLVPLEAMSIGRPVVATGTGGSGEYLRDGENSLIFSPKDDPAALAAAVRRLAAEPELRERLREGGLRTAAAHTARAFDEAVATELERAAGLRSD